MARDSKGRFVKGDDPDRASFQFGNDHGEKFKPGEDERRHKFTDEECRAGFAKLCEKMSGAGSLYKRAQAVRFLYHVDNARWGTPIPEATIRQGRKPRGKSR